MQDTQEDAPEEPLRSVVYHRPCHLRTAGQGDEDESLLRQILGGQVHHVGERCCGFGGALQLAAPDLSARVAEDCWAGLCESDANQPGYTVLTGCTACVYQLAATAPSEAGVGHWLEIFY